MALNPEVISAVLAGLAWICGGVTALVAFAWKISSKVQRHLDKVNDIERVMTNHEKRLRRIEKHGNVLQFPSNT